VEQHPLLLRRFDRMGQKLSHPLDAYMNLIVL
jgi:hypothetical protein